MKNLKTIIILVTLLLFTQVVVAQLLPTFVIKGGVSSASLTTKDDYVKYSEVSDNRLGYTFGAGVEFPLNPLMSLETGLLYAQKGMKAESGGIKLEFSPTYLELPLGIKFKPTLANVGLYGTVGTYLGYGIGGETKGTFAGSVVSITGSDDIAWGSGKNDDLKPFDFGFNLAAGVILGQLEAGVYSSGSLINISPVTKDGETMRNIVFGVMFGFRI